jgi:hypothetical protein
MSAFSMFVPANWQLIDLTGDISAQVDRAIVNLTSGMQTAAAFGTARVVRDRLVSGLRDLAREGGLGCLMPVDSLLAQPVRPILLVRTFVAPEGVSPLEALVGLAASTPGAELMDIDHLVGLRISTEAKSSLDASDIVTVLLDLEAAEEASVAASKLLAKPLGRSTHRVRYILGSPSDDKLWADVMASVTVDDDPAGRLLAESVLPLFDELARSFHWDEAAA